MLRKILLYVKLLKTTIIIICGISLSNQAHAKYLLLGIQMVCIHVGNIN